jgi:Lrp/AsnC family transcriptional regulator, leucine-responsive regulatory protein
VELDDLDRRILSELQTDASLTNLALAIRVHASAPTCLRRVRRLVQNRVIERQVAIVAPAALGTHLTAIVEVTLASQAAERLAEFEHRVVQETEIQQCYRVTPSPDFVLIALLRDMPAYHALAHRLLTGQAQVRNVRCFFATHRSKFDTRVPLAFATADRVSRPG